MNSTDYIKFDDQQLQCVIYCMQNGKQLDEYESAQLQRLVEIKQLRTDYKMAQGSTDDISTKLREA